MEISKRTSNLLMMSLQLTWWIFKTWARITRPTCPCLHSSPSKIIKNFAIWLIRPTSSISLFSSSNKPQILFMIKKLPNRFLPTPLETPFELRQLRLSRATCWLLLCGKWASIKNESTLLTLFLMITLVTVGFKEFKKLSPPFLILFNIGHRMSRNDNLTPSQ